MEVTPVSGKKSITAASEAGLAAFVMPTLFVPPDNRSGLGHAIAQVVAEAEVYVLAGNGSLYRLETGDEKDDGWLMWGVNAAHYGKPR